MNILVYWSDNLNITNYDKWKFRRCIETLNRYGCFNSYEGNEGENCRKCKFNIDNDMWDYLHCRTMRLEDSAQWFYNVSE